MKELQQKYRTKREMAAAANPEWTETQKNIQDLIDFLTDEELSPGFAMETWAPRLLQKGFDYLRRNNPKENWDYVDYRFTYGMPGECGSACCIGGHGQTLFDCNSKEVPEKLGLPRDPHMSCTRATSANLFHPSFRYNDRVYNYHNERIPLEMAVCCLEILRDEGKVDWCAAAEKHFEKQGNA